MDNMSKETLNELIKLHENQIAENQRKIDELRGYAELPPNQDIDPMFGQAFSLNDARKYLSTYGNVRDIHNDEEVVLSQGNLFISKEAAELEAEKRKLRQCARIEIAKSWGDLRPDWDDCNQYKWVVYFDERNDLEWEMAFNKFETLHFRTSEDAISFISLFGEEAIRNILSL